jgi:hypothetical protein
MVARLSLLQLFLAFAVATARNDSPPSSERGWLPPGLFNYENELADAAPTPEDYNDCHLRSTLPTQSFITVS